MAKVIKFKDNTYLDGTIIESGNNENGYYEKYSNGKMKCWHRQEISGASTNFTTAYGSIFLCSSSGMPSWTYPKPFIEPPEYINATLETSGIGGAPIVAGSNAPTRYSAKCWPWNATSWSGVTLHIYWKAIGKWK